MESIEIRYASVGSSNSSGGGGFSTGFYHKYTIYTDADGNKHDAKGGPVLMAI
jgi:hypothetical protein